MQLKIVYKEEQKVLWVNRKEDTYRNLFEMSMQEYFGKDYEQIVKKENFRLRAYNVQYRIMLDTYKGREDDTLEVLKIYPMKTLALEEKGDMEEFEDYDPN